MFYGFYIPIPIVFPNILLTTFKLLVILLNDVIEPPKTPLLITFRLLVTLLTDVSIFPNTPLLATFKLLVILLKDVNVLLTIKF